MVTLTSLDCPFQYPTILSEKSFLTSNLSWIFSQFAFAFSSARWDPVKSCLSIYIYILKSGTVTHNEGLGFQAPNIVHTNHINTQISNACWFKSGLPFVTARYIRGSYKCKVTMLLSFFICIFSFPLATWFKRNHERAKEQPSMERSFYHSTKPFSPSPQHCSWSQDPSPALLCLKKNVKSSLIGLRPVITYDSHDQKQGPLTAVAFNACIHLWVEVPGLYD